MRELSKTGADVGFRKSSNMRMRERGPQSDSCGPSPDRAPVQARVDLKALKTTSRDEIGGILNVIECRRLTLLGESLRGKHVVSVEKTEQLGKKNNSYVK